MGMRKLAPLGWMALGAVGGVLALIAWVAYRFWESMNGVAIR